MSTLDTLTNDPHYKTKMAVIVGRWQKMIESPTFWRGFGPQGDEAKEQLKNAIYGMQDAYSGYVEDIKDGITAAQGLKPFLNRRTANGKTFYAALKQAAKASRIPMRTFYEDLHYMNEKLDIGLDMKKLDPELVPPKTHIPGENTWENYAKAHLVNPPYSPKQKAQYLAKAMAGAFLAGEKKRNANAKETEFNRENADKMAKYIMDKPAFKLLSQDTDLVTRMLREGAKDPDKLFDEAVRFKRPFYNIGEDKCREILGNLKKMEPLMDEADAYDDKWRTLRESIRSIDLESDDPALSGEMKLQEIMNNTTAFMKGKKSLRRNEEQQNCFDQSLDVLAELSKGSKQAECEAQILINRINKVRSGHDKKHKDIGLRNYGVSNIWKHTNSEDDILVNDYYDKLKYKDGVRPVIQRESRYVFEPYPQDDFSQLERMPSGIAPKKLRRAATRDLHDYMEKDVLPTGDAMTFVAAVLALSDTKMYFRESREIGKSDVVIDEGAYNQNIMKYVTDPAVMQLAQKYASREARLALTGGSDDVLNVNIKQLKQEYAAAKKELAEAQNPAGAHKAEGARPEGPQIGLV